MQSCLPKRGISTLEIIVIFGVIAVLVALAVPDILYERHSRERAHEAKCMSNMRQLSLAIMMEAQDNNDILPAANRWMEKLDVSSAGSFDCPGTTYKGTKTAPDYMYVAAFIHNKHSLLSRRALKEIKDTSQAIELVELRNPGKVGQTAYVSDEIKIGAKSYGYDPATALYSKIDRLRHNEGSIVAYIDGHVDYLKALKFPNSLLKNSMTAHEPIIKP